MIACYRRMPHFLSNNVRTFFCNTPKAAPLDAKWLENVVKHHKNGTTTSGSEYRTIRVRDNVRVFLINNLETVDEERVYCSIQIGVGSLEDPDDCLGLAHLLEHVICNIVFGSKMYTLYRGETFPVRTVYTFIPTCANYAEALRAWSKLLFSESKLESLDSKSIEIMKSQRDVVDNEWRETNCTPQDNHKIVEILRVEGMDASKFRCGNKETLQQTDDDQQMKYLNQLRDRYRESPVDVFLYSKVKLEMETVLESLNVEDFLQKGQATEAQPIDWKKRHQKDLKEHLFVVKSDYDWQQLVIVFPLNKHISRKEVNTLDFISEMIESTADGSLSRNLIERNWATKCVGVEELNLFLIYVRLTNEGLENIRIVQKAVQNYLMFLHHQWATLHKFQYIAEFTINVVKEWNTTPEQLIHRIASCYDIKADEFDESHLMHTLDEDEAQQFISEQLLDNKTIVRMILSRDPDGVVQTLVKNYRRSFPRHFTSLKDMNERKDAIFNTQFYTRDESTLFTTNVAVDITFQLPDLTKIKTVTTCIPLEKGLIIEPEDTSYQRLLITHLDLECARFWSPFYKGFFNAPFQMPFCVARVDKVSDFLNKPENLKMDDKKFQLSKHRLMCEQSLTMTAPIVLAISLMETAVGNCHMNRKIQPIPMQYKALSTMTLLEYAHHAAALKENPNFKKIFEEGFTNINNDGSFGKEYLIEAINRNEPATVTLLFCVTGSEESLAEDMNRYLHSCCIDIRKERNLYTVICDVWKFVGIRGILLRIFSVACKENQTNDKILELLDEKMKTSLPHKIDAAGAWNKLEPLYTHMLKRKILVQIKGHTSCRDNDSDFKTQFDAWYKDHEPTFSEIVA